MKTHFILAAALALTLFTGCANSGGPKSASRSPSVKLPPMGTVALVGSSYPQKVHLLESSKGEVFRQSLDDGSSAMVSITDSIAAKNPGSDPNSAAGIAGVSAVPVALWHGMRAVTLGTFTGTAESTLRPARAVLADSKVTEGIQGRIADAFRAGQPALPVGARWLPEQFRNTEAARLAGADTAFEIEVLSVGLKQLGGAWGMRVQATAQFVRLRDGDALQTFSAEYLTPAKHTRPLGEWTRRESPLMEAEMRTVTAELAASFGRQLQAAVAQP